MPAWSLFAIPKPFTGAAEIAQRNAIGSWLRLLPGHQILLLGDGPGIGEIAKEFGLRHQRELGRNPIGTPLLTDAFSAATEVLDRPLLMYANADVMFDESMNRAIERLEVLAKQPFLAIGRRVNVHIDRIVRWDEAHEVRWVEGHVAAGEIDSAMCKDYFLFPRGWFANMPEFAVGRGNWDNWIVHSAKQMGLPVIDLSPSALAIHPKHDYAHVSGGRTSAYVRGPEARANQRLAGGRHWISGSTATHRLTPQALRRNRFSKTPLPFLLDLPRTLALARKVLYG